MSASVSSSSVQDFSVLELMSQRAIYQEANETHNVDLVRHLNGLGMKPKVLNFAGPAIISNLMDIATKHDLIFGFLKQLRETNRLQTEKEFQPLLAKKWIQKSGLGRIMGCDHLMRKIMEKELKHIKVPLKIAVVEDSGSLNVIGRETSNNFYEVHSDQVKIYAEEIQYVERKLSRDEINELIQIIAAAHFVDLCPANIIVAENGVYLIDTEFKSFAGALRWADLQRFESLISEEDKAYFEKLVHEKMAEPKDKIESIRYDYFTFVVNAFDKLPSSSIEQHKDVIEDFKNKVANLEYVGAKKVGAWLSPNKFSFNLSDILIKKGTGNASYQARTA